MVPVEFPGNGYFEKARRMLNERFRRRWGTFKGRKQQLPFFHFNNRNNFLSVAVTEIIFPCWV